MVKKKEVLGDYLHRKFLELERESHKRRTLQWYANYLDIKQPTLSMLMNTDRAPSLETVLKLAEKLGPEVFAIVGIEVPRIVPSPVPDDPEFLRIRDLWDGLTAEERGTIMETLDRLVNENASGQAGSESMGDSGGEGQSDCGEPVAGAGPGVAGT